MGNLKLISMIFWFTFFILIFSSNLFAQGEKTTLKMERIQQELVPPPGVPNHEQAVSAVPRIVEVRLTIQEKRHQIAPDGAAIWAMTYEGSIPAPLIVVHQNDYVELTLVNPSNNILQHNIDFHAATGALGGGELSKVNPGQQAILLFKATKPGVFVYHCAPGGAMTPLHVVSGMNGAIMVLPRDGLRDSEGRSVTYDKAYYIGEQDFYLPRNESGGYKQYSTPVAGFGDMLVVMKTLTPTHLVFNGEVGALLGEKALKAKVGEKVLFIHSQANRDSRIHLIGGHADLFWQGGSFAERPLTNFETWMVPGGTAVAALYEFRQPGKYVYVNHNLIEGILFGAVAEVEVEGKWNNDLMRQLSAPGPIER